MALNCWAGGRGTANWCDIGSGPGLPGMVIAILMARQCELERAPRPRADFLRRVISELGLRDVTIAECKVERLERQVRLHHRPSGGSARQIVRHGVASGPQRDEMGASQR